jgi:uncharacterized protein YbgA (DUF1722 family)/uncharacterized protein YbbK (DUF523 family)
LIASKVDNPLNNRSKFTKIKIGISSCLLGKKVRYDGGHKHDHYLTDTLGRYFDWTPVCPEIEIGMSVPRETIRLVGDVESPKLVGHKTNHDYSEKMNRWSEVRLEKLATLDLCGYILKKNSPSCGMERVRVYSKSGMPIKNGVGLYARKLLQHFPLLPVEEEGRLNDPHLRENFIERVFAYRRLQHLLKSNPKAKDIVAFHTAHKFSLLSHGRPHYQKLGQLTAQAGKFPIEELTLRYAELFMEALKYRATQRKHADVLYHIMGFFKKKIDAEDKHELIDAIDNYRNGYYPLIVPLTLIKHHLRRHPDDWVSTQVYLNPYPEELMLRNVI